MPAALLGGANAVRDLLALVRRHLDLDVAYVSRLNSETCTLCEVDADASSPLSRGGPMSRQRHQTYCGLVASGVLPQLMTDTLDHPVARGLAVTGELAIRANISVPVVLSDGTVYGMFCAFSHQPNPALNERDLNVVKLFAHLASLSIEAELTADRAAREKRDRLEPYLSGRTPLTMMLQPVWDVTAEVPFGAEALCRFSGEPKRGPDKWFAEAGEVGLGAQLELAAVRRALETLPYLPQDSLLMINASPETVIDPGFGRMLEGAPFERLVVEITEHAIVEEYEPLVKALTPFRHSGLRIAVDDMGGGYASLCHVLKLQPDVIKADMSIVRNIDSDASRRAMISAMAGFAAETDTILLAEGVETAPELSTLLNLGVDLAQGYFLSRPVAAETIGDTIDSGLPHGGRAAIDAIAETTRQDNALGALHFPAAPASAAGG
ncbi:diguanylate phosphodiesterase [Stappia sp. 22II-S9-Z10]|nr:diguanylate phosphodiesterase [Stappia sp. 22II-S9-Z10]